MPVPVQPPHRAVSAVQDDLVDAVTPQHGPPGVAPPPPRVVTEPLSQLYVLPDRWQVMAGRIVPLCGQLPMVPGCNQVDGGTGEATDASTAIAKITRRGGIPLPFDIDGRSYVRRIRGHGGWIFRWQRVFAGSSHIETDSEAFGDWLVGLVDRGLIPRAPLYALNALRAELISRAAQLEGVGRDKYVRKLAALERDIREVERAIDSYDDAAARDPRDEAGADDVVPRGGE